MTQREKNSVDITVNVDDMEKYITNAVNNNKEQLQQCLDFMDTLDIPSGNSISRGDIAFLQAVCLEEKPNAIMEIGTWVGRSAYTMAIASEADIYTCDSGDNMFIEIEEYSDKIHCHPNTHSDIFLKQKLPKFDMVFIDGFDAIVEDVFNVCQDSFTLVAHDFFDVNTLEHCKGMTILWKIAEYANNNGYDYKMYIPKRDWIPSGYPVFDFGGVNAYCGMIKVSKNK